MKLTQELIDKIQEAMLHTNLKGEINWKDGDDIEVQVAGTFAKDKFIVLKNATKNPFENAQPHPHFDYLEGTIIDQIEILTEELGGKMSKSTRHDYTGRSSKIITIEYDIKES